ncbi:MAG: hypothetical protein QM784_19720 [Polyangiaceae bacterium]
MLAALTVMALVDVILMMPGRWASLAVSSLAATLVYRRLPVTAG